MLTDPRPSLVGSSGRATAALFGLAWLFAALLILTLAPERAAAASTLHVAENHSNCSDKGAGSASQPFCTIGAAVAKVTAGTTVRVAGGVYDEQVSVKSGTSSAPTVFEAAPDETVTVRGGHYGFYVSSKAWVRIKGFNVTDTVSDGFHVSSFSKNVELLGNHVSHAGAPGSGTKAKGISLTDTSDATVQDNHVERNSDFGIYLQKTTRTQVTRNEVESNAREYQRAASGIRLYNASDNTVSSNSSHGNEDSGIEFVAGAKNNLAVNNVTHANGDHGIDILESTGHRVIANSVHDNVTAGINAEGSSSGTTMSNNVSVDNGLNSPRTRGNIRVDSTSTLGSVVDFDLVHLTRPGTMIVWGSGSYSSLSAMQAMTGQETKGLEADPNWADPAGGDLHLGSSSPAIDSANSGASGQTAVDMEGKGRADARSVPDTGTGSRTYDDRGAHEYQPQPEPPAAAVSVTPSVVPVGGEVMADASASTDPDGEIASYEFDFGDGLAPVGPQPEASAAHSYRAGGTYTVTVTVTDDSGRSSTATSEVTVEDAPPTASLSVAPESGNPPLEVAVDASASHDREGEIESYSFDFGDGSPEVGPQSNPTATHTYEEVGRYSVKVTVTDKAGQTSTEIREVRVFGENVPPEAALSVTPDSGKVNLEVVADASGSTDAEGRVESYTFDFGDGSPEVGPQPQATAKHTYRAAGTYTVRVTATDEGGEADTATREVVVEDAPPDPALTVAPSAGMAPHEVTADAAGSTDTDDTRIESYAFDFGDGSPPPGPQSSATASHTYQQPGTYTVTVTVTDEAGLSAQTTQPVTVRPNLIGNPGFETGLSGWNTSGGSSTVSLTRASSGRSGDGAALLTNTGTSTATCTLNDSPNWVRTTMAGRYEASLWARSDAPGATLRLRLREYSGATLVGSQIAQQDLTTSWQRVAVEYAAVAPGTSALDLNAYVTGAPPGTCFFADDIALDGR